MDAMRVVLAADGSDRPVRPRPAPFVSDHVVAGCCRRAPYNASPTPVAYVGLCTTSARPPRENGTPRRTG